MATLEERVARLEADMQEIRHGVLAGQAAHAHGLNVLNNTLARFEESTGASFGDLRSELTGLSGEITGLKTDMAGVKTELTRLSTGMVGVKDTLDTIVAHLTGEGHQ